MLQNILFLDYYSIQYLVATESSAFIDGFVRQRSHAGPPCLETGTADTAEPGSAQRAAQFA